MAKSKKSKAGKAAGKIKPTKLPKQIGGILISKTLRKEGGALVDLMRNPVIAGLAAAVLTALTEAIRDAGRDSDATPRRSQKSPADFGQGAAILGTILAARALETLKKP